MQYPKYKTQVSIHARLATGDILTPHEFRLVVFQFTPVLRRATGLRRLWAYVVVRFNSRPSCDGRHAPTRSAVSGTRFQFTPVLRRATIDINRLAISKVSIHARLATGDSPAALEAAPSKFQFTPVLRRATSDRRRDIHPQRFNSRPSCDGRPH